jgi:proline dehydrogenase
MIGNNFLVKTGGSLAKTAVSISLPIGWAVKPTIYKLFVGGETMESCNPIIENFAKHNVKIVLDYSVEGGKTDAQIQAALDETLRTIDNAAINSNIPYAVFKPTAFGLPEILEKAGEGKQLNEIEQKEAEKFEIRVKKLCQRAYEKNVPIMIDAEDYAYQNYVDEVVYKMMFTL